MSWEDHEQSEINRKLNIDQRLKEVNNAKNIANDPNVQHDLMMLERLGEYELDEHAKKFIKYILSLPEEKRDKMLFNYIQGRTGSVILHYENKYVRKINDKKFNQ